jgi:hypothetical protein
MNVLLTHLHLDWPAGSETCTYTLAAGLRSAGHDVTVVTPIAGEVARRIRELGVLVLEDLADAAGRPFDVVHAQHNVMAVAARVHVPTVPLLFHSHGTVPDPEQPPSLDANVQLYVAVSEAFSGKRYGRRPSVDELGSELAAYGAWMGPANRALAEERCGLERHVEDLVRLYNRAISQFRPRDLALPTRELDAVLRTLRARIGEREARLEQHQTRIHLLQLKLRDRARDLERTAEERR